MNAAGDIVRMGDVAVAGTGATLRALGVGSCVVIVLYDADSGIGGIAHPLLPEPANGNAGQRRGRYVSTALEPLLERMRAQGADPARITARLVGGASMFPGLDGSGDESIGERNVLAARHTLQAAGITVAAEDVGGNYGRSIEFRLADGGVRIRSVQRAHVEL